MFLKYILKGLAAIVNPNKPGKYTPKPDMKEEIAFYRRLSEEAKRAGTYGIRHREPRFEEGSDCQEEYK